MAGTVIVILVLAVLTAAAAWYWIMVHQRHPTHHVQVFGTTPKIPAAHAQGSMPTLKMPKAIGWASGTKPKTAPGLAVSEFAGKLVHPRWIYTLPNGDVLIAEAATLPGKVTSIYGFAMNQTMKRAGALYQNANRITLLRDADGDGVPEIRETFLEGLNQPFGMALVGDTFYVGNTDSIVAFPYVTGQTKITAPGKKLTDLKPGGHWTRNIVVSKDQTKLFIGVGSLSNIGDDGFEAEVERAAILELDLVTNQRRIFAGGLRNPVGMAYEPTTGSLWTVVNERDGLGDETPPDYLTSVKDGGFYGWPYSYWGQTVDDRVQPQDHALVASATAPDFALGGHTASLGLCWLPENTLPGYPAGMVIGQHGSWNRSKLSGYRVVLVPFENGKPTGQPIDLLTGFLADDEKTSNGRPVGVALAADGALLVADDVGHNIWRIVPAAR